MSDDKLGDGRDDVVVVPRAKYWHMRYEAACWRKLNESPLVFEVLDAWHEWSARRDAREMSWALASAAIWGSVGPTYRELANRRATYAEDPLTPDEIRARAAQSWARIKETKGAA